MTSRSRHPRTLARLASVWTVVLAGLLAVPHAAAETDVLTRQYDNTRAGANTGERALNPPSLRTGRFHRLFSLQVDEKIETQILIVRQVLVAGGNHRDLALGRWRRDDGRRSLQRLEKALTGDRGRRKSLHARGR